MEQTNRVRLVVWGVAGVGYSFIEAEGIVAGETATWKCAVDDTGFFWLYKNNVLLNSVQGSTVPANMVRLYVRKEIQVLLPEPTIIDSPRLSFSNTRTGLYHSAQIHTNKLLGQSTLPETSSLYGAVLGLRLRHFHERPHLRDLDLLNLPGQVSGPFTATFYARFDDVSSDTRHWQVRVYCCFCS